MGVELDSPARRGAVRGLLGHIDPRFLLYGTTSFWVQFAMGGWFVGTTPEQVDALLLFIFAAGVAQLACGLAYLAAGSRRLSVRSFGDLSFLCAAGTLLIVPCLLVPAVPLALLAAVGALFGAGCIASYGAWSACYARAAGLDVLGNAAMSQLLAGLVAFCVSRMACVAGLLLVSLLYVASSLVQRRLCRDGACACEVEEPAGLAPYGVGETAITRLVPVVLLFAATVVAAAATGGATTATSRGLGGLFVPCATFCVACAVAVWDRRGKNGLVLAFVVLAALAATGIVADVASAGGGRAAFVDTAFFFAVDLSNVFGWVFVCSLARTRYAASPLFAVVLRAVMGLAFAASMVLAHAGLAIALSGVLEALLFVALLVCAGVLFGAGRSTLGTAASARAAQTPDTSGEADRLAGGFASFGFSAREAEVAAYLVRGYRAPYIAEKLCISENTVRTHIKSMYRKCDVGSRNEFLELFEDGPRATVV